AGDRVQQPARLLAALSPPPERHQPRRDRKRGGLAIIESPLIVQVGDRVPPLQPALKLEPEAPGGRNQILDLAAQAKRGRRRARKEPQPGPPLHRREM